VAGADGARAKSEAAGRVLQGVLDELQLSISIADAAGIYESPITSINVYAGILRDVGRYGEVVEELQKVLPRLNFFTDPRLVDRLAKTAGSLNRAVSNDPALASRLAYIRRELDDWKSSSERA
jgi:hypothetical protein